MSVKLDHSVSRIGRRNGIASETSRKSGKKWVLEVYGRHNFREEKMS